MKLFEYEGRPGRWGRVAQDSKAAGPWYIEYGTGLIARALVVHIEQEGLDKNRPWRLAGHGLDDGRQSCRWRYLPFEFDTLEAAALFAEMLAMSGLDSSQVPWL